MRSFGFVSKTHSTTPIPSIFKPLAIPPRCRGVSGTSRSPIKSSLHPVIAKLAPESKITLKEDGALLHQSSIVANKAGSLGLYIATGVMIALKAEGDREQSTK